MKECPIRLTTGGVAKIDKVIAIRQYGSGGRQIGRLVSERLSIPFYDKEIIQRAASKSGIHTSYFIDADQNGTGSPIYSITPGVTFELSIQDKLYLSQRNAILTLAATGPCVMVGHGACEVLKGQLPLLCVFIYADIETRICRVLEEYQEPPENIEKRIYETDKKRMIYYSFYERKRKQGTSYFDICVDSGNLGIDGAVQVVLSAYR